MGDMSKCVHGDAQGYCDKCNPKMTPIDKEHLEFAARAAGYELLGYNESTGECYCRYEGKEFFWNPITDDGDALRLAVKLELQIATHRNTKMSCASSTKDFIKYFIEEWNGDPYAATRRAIVRAAAEIGRRIEMITPTIDTPEFRIALNHYKHAVNEDRFRMELISYINAKIAEVVKAERGVQQAIQENYTNLLKINKGLRERELFLHSVISQIHNSTDGVCSMATPIEFRGDASSESDPISKTVIYIPLEQTP